MTLCTAVSSITSLLLSVANGGLLFEFAEKEAGFQAVRVASGESLAFCFICCFLEHFDCCQRSDYAWFTPGFLFVTLIVVVVCDSTYLCVFI